MSLFSSALLYCVLVSSFDSKLLTLFPTGVYTNEASRSISTSLDNIVRDSLQQESNYYGIAGAQNAATIASSLPDQRPTVSGASNPQDPSILVPTDRPRLGEFSYNEEDLSQVDKDLIFEGLKQLYYKKVQNESFTIHLAFVVSFILCILFLLMWQVLPLEVASKYAHFASPPMGPSDFDAKPLVLILGAKQQCLNQFPPVSVLFDTNSLSCRPVFRWKDFVYPVTAAAGFSRPTDRPRAHYRPFHRYYALRQ